MNVFNQLEDDGHFIFQFQNWKSYKKRKNVTEKIKENFNSIKLKPEKFEEYLQKTYGYKLVKKIHLPSNSKKMFERPIYVFRKNVIYRGRNL